MLICATVRNGPLADIDRLSPFAGARITIKVDVEWLIAAEIQR